MLRSTFARIALLGAAISAAVVAFIALDRFRRSWGVDPAETAKPLPGDDLVAEPGIRETRGLTIDAPPAAVWPWLVQMGYERAGWYSYDQLDMKGSSGQTIVPEWQTLNVGDVVPTHPTGGFEVRVLEPGRALVLYTDTAIVAAQAAKAAGSTESVPAGLQFSDRFMRTTPPDFAASWALVVEPLEGGRSRLIERVSAWFGAATTVSAITGPAFGFGVFLMTRRQMLGIRERAERLAHSSLPVTSEAAPTLDPGGHNGRTPEPVGASSV